MSAFRAVLFVACIMLIAAVCLAQNVVPGIEKGRKQVRASGAVLFDGDTRWNAQLAYGQFVTDRSLLGLGLEARGNGNTRVTVGLRWEYHWFDRQRARRTVPFFVAGVGASFNRHDSFAWTAGLGAKVFLDSDTFFFISGRAISFERDPRIIRGRSVGGGRHTFGLFSVGFGQLF